MRYICHCSVSAFDGNAVIKSKPTVRVQADDRIRASRQAVKQLEEKYEKLGCSHITVAVVLVKELKS